jgi:hypothetical protein
MPDLPKAELNVRRSDDFKFPKDHKWSTWHLSLRPKVVGVWFERIKIPLDALPTKTGGVYQIAVKRQDDDDMLIVYTGRATKVNTSAKGIHLRARLLQYMKSGFDLGNELRKFLELNFGVWLRWCTLDTVGDCRTTETDLLKLCDFAFNCHNNPPYRSPAEVLWNRNGQTCLVLDSIINAHDDCSSDDEDQDVDTSVCEGEREDEMIRAMEKFVSSFGRKFGIAAKVSVVGMDDVICDLEELTIK